MAIDIEKGKKVILFDGVCNLCNNSVQYVIKHDKKNHFMFAPLQSIVGMSIIKKFNIDTNKMDSILLYDPDKNTLNYKSTAALKIASHLGVPTNVLRVFFIIPAFIRNWIYDFIAKNRYKWYGKKDACMIPTPELKSKFLE
jgi:predicted DCC family thiol-disulfide oxidoreductase YuxK